MSFPTAIRRSGCNEFAPHNETSPERPVTPLPMTIISRTELASLEVEFDGSLIASDATLTKEIVVTLPGKFSIMWSVLPVARSINSTCPKRPAASVWPSGETASAVIGRI